MGQRLESIDREAHLAEIKHAYEEGGLTIKELAFLYDVSYGAMHFRLNAAGANIRPRSDQPPIKDPVVSPLSLPCVKCGANAGRWCHNTFAQKINHFHVARKRAAAEVDRSE